MEFKQFLLEISKKELEKIDLNRDLQFNNIFGDKLRILIPLNQNENLNQLIRDLEKLGYEVDYQDLIKKKTVYKRIKTQQGEKIRPEKVGKIFNRIDSAFGQWWQKNSDKLKNSDTEGYSIIISRSPIDILRMSDHDNISSCHRTTGEFFHCAKQEAKTGGAIAYVVKNSDLQGINLQNPEIFEDSKRKINGIKPLERLRLRRFSVKDLDLLVPDGRTYGEEKNKNSGFRDAVEDWARNSQKEVMSSIDPIKDYEDAKVRGGSYFDRGHEPSVLWSKFFKTNVSGYKSSIDNEEETEDLNGNLEERAENALNHHKNNWKHIDVTFELHDDDNEPILDYSGYASFSIPKRLFAINVEEEFDDKDYIGRKSYREFIEIISDAIDIYPIEFFDEYQEHENNYIFSFSIRDDNDERMDQMTKFERFLDYIDDVDRNFDDKINKVYAKLIEKGYLKNVQEKIEFKNFTTEIDEYGTEIYSNPEKVGFLQNFPVRTPTVREFSRHYNSSDVISLGDLKDILLFNINKLQVFPFKLKGSEINLYMLRSQSRIEKETQAISGGTEPGQSTLGVPPFAFLTGWVFVEFNKTINLNMMSNKNILNKIVHVDRNFDFYIKKLAKVFESVEKSILEKIKINHSNIHDISKDPLYHKILRPIDAEMQPVGVGLSKKPYIPKNPYIQKQFKFESFKNWLGFFN